MSRTVLITGASHGLGARMAEQAAKHQHRVYLLGRDGKALEQTRNRILQDNPEVQVLPFTRDLTDPDAVQDLVTWLNDKDWPDIVIFNAGAGTFGPFHRIPPTKLVEPVRLMAEFTVEFSRLCIPRMLTAGHGLLVFMGSTAGRKPVPYMAVYSSAKGFLHRFAMALAEEYRETPIGIQLFILGGMKTEFHKRAGYPTPVPDRRMDPSKAAEKIWTKLEQGRTGVFVVGTWKERLGGWLQHALPESWWARRMKTVYRPLVSATPEIDKNTNTDTNKNHGSER